MRIRVGIGCFLLLLVTKAVASVESEWLSASLGQPKVGTTHWTVVMTTGHFGSDPQLAESSRVYVENLLFAVGSKQDTVEVIAAELSVWHRSKSAPLSDVRSLLPLTSAPNSKGGRDIERVALEVAKHVKGVLLIVSPGASQLARDGSGELLGGELTLAGFDVINRRNFDLNTPSGSRNLLTIAVQKPGGFTGQEPRAPISVPVAAQSKEEVVTPEKAPSSSSSNSILMLLSGAGVLGLGLLIGRRSRAPIVSQDAPTQSSVSDQDEPSEEIAAEDVEIWKTNAKSLQKRFDLIADEMESVVARLESAKDNELVELRGKLHQQQKMLENCDTVAIDFIDGLARLKAMSGPDNNKNNIIDTVIGQHMRLMQRVGLDSIAPAVGSEFIEGLHRIEEYDEAKDGGEVGAISELISPGFRRGDKVIRQAKVKIWR